MAKPKRSFFFGNMGERYTKNRFNKCLLLIAIVDNVKCLMEFFVCRML